MLHDGAPGAHATRPTLHVASGVAAVELLLTCMMHGSHASCSECLLAPCTAATPPPPLQALASFLALKPEYCARVLRALMARMQHGPASALLVAAAGGQAARPHLYHRKLSPFPFLTSPFHAWGHEGGAGCAAWAAESGQVWVPGMQQLALAVLTELVSGCWRGTHCMVTCVCAVLADSCWNVGNCKYRGMHASPIHS